MRSALLVVCSCLTAALFGPGILEAGATAPVAAKAAAAPLRLDAQGGFAVGARPLFLVALSNPPPLTATTPAGESAPVAIARAGVNLVRVGPAWTGWTRSELLSVLRWDREAVRLGLRTWVRLNTFAATRPRWPGDAHLAGVVHTLTRSPTASGIGLWQGADEPWSRGIQARSLAFFYCRLTWRGPRSACAGEPRLDRRHLLVTILAPHGSRADLTPYRRVSDGLGVDVYPVTYGNTDPDLHQVGAWTRAIAGIGADHFVWTTLQICSVHSVDRATGAYVLPTAFQERYMLFDAIINGARGVSFFGGQNPRCWDRADRRYGWNWTFWTHVLEPLIATVGSRSALAPALAAAGSNQVLETSDPGVEAISRVAVTPAGRELWVLAARNSPGEGRVAISGLPAAGGTAAVYGERRLVELSHGTLEDTFRRWQVHVYRITLPAVRERRARGGARVRVARARTLASRPRG